VHAGVAAGWAWVASTEPRLDVRGERAAAVGDRIHLRAASTEPRLDVRGELHVGGAGLLQVGASTEPRLDVRGEVRSEKPVPLVYSLLQRSPGSMSGESLALRHLRARKNTSGIASVARRNLSKVGVFLRALSRTLDKLQRSPGSMSGESAARASVYGSSFDASTEPRLDVRGEGITA